MVGFEHEHSFDLFGSTVRLLIGPPARADLPPPELAAIELEAFLRAMHRKLTRFDSDSELCRLNDDPASECTVSPMLALALRAGLWAADQSGGLVDPTLVRELERAGYARSRVGVKGASLSDALKDAPPRSPAQPAPDARWREISVDQTGGTVRRPPGLRFDTGGSGKGLAADLASGRLDGYSTHAVDAGGDLRLGGATPLARSVSVESPLSSENVFEFELTDGAVATSGLATRIWRSGDGYAHHLIDPSTGQPAWTGVIQATALAPTALAAETLAKSALLSGPDRGRALLAEQGGVLVLDNGEVELVGPLSNRTAALADAI
jgi:thiamine biosynthesis lipoprotein